MYQHNLKRKLSWTHFSCLTTTRNILFNPVFYVYFECSWTLWVKAELGLEKHEKIYMQIFLDLSLVASVLVNHWISEYVSSILSITPISDEVDNIFKQFRFKSVSFQKPCIFKSADDFLIKELDNYNLKTIFNLILNLNFQICFGYIWR